MSQAVDLQDMIASLCFSLLTTPLHSPVITDAPAVAHATSLFCHLSSPLTLVIRLVMVLVVLFASALSTACISTMLTSTFPFVAQSEVQDFLLCHVCVG